MIYHFKKREGREKMRERERERERFYLILLKLNLNANVMCFHKNKSNLANIMQRYCVSYK